MIHEYDPYFNYRATAYLAKNGFLKFFNWFDERSWYPLGRSIGQTVLMFLYPTPFYFPHTTKSALSSHPSLLISSLSTLPSPPDLSWPPLDSSRAFLGRKCDRDPDFCQDCVRLPGTNLFWCYLCFDIPPRERVWGWTRFWPGLRRSDRPRPGLLIEVRDSRA